MTTSSGRGGRAVMLACALLLAGGGQGVRAQSADGGSARTLTFSVSAGLRATDNPDFTVSPDEGEIRASTDLRMEFRGETPLGNLTLGADTLLMGRLSGDADKRFERPRQALRLGYAREAADSALKLTASYNESRIDFLRPLTDFIDEDGVIVLPDDLDDLNGTGWRRQAAVDGSLTLGRNAPFGVVLGAGLSDLGYRDASDPSLVDSRRRHVSARMRFDLTRVTRLDVGLRYSIFENDLERKETWSLSPGLTIDRPDGNIRFLLGATRTEDGTRISAEVGRLIERPWGRLDARIGAVRLSGGRTRLSGGLELDYVTAQGQLTLGLERSAVSGTNDDETLRTALSASYQQALSDLASISVNLAYVRSDNSRTDLGTDTASFGLSYRRMVTRDWSLNLGYNHRMRDAEGSGRRSENEVTIGLSRSFSFGL